MSDVVDVAQDIEAQDMAVILANRPRNPTGISATNCEECDAKIPEARRLALPGIQTCVCCAQLNEEKRHLKKGVLNRMLTLDESGKPLTVTLDDCTMPAEYNFRCVNDFVHGVSVSFEELQALCLGLATQLDKIAEVLDELCANAEPVCDCLEMGQTLKSPETLINFRRALNDGWEAL